jgi:hypothetical protein
MASSHCAPSEHQEVGGGFILRLSPGVIHIRLFQSHLKDLIHGKFPLRASALQEHNVKKVVDILSWTAMPLQGFRGVPQENDLLDSLWLKFQENNRKLLLKS